jgi:L-ribulose-5-phosphate 3-epimerase
MENRRDFLKTLTAVMAVAPAGMRAQQTPAPATGGKPSPPNPATLRKSTLISMLPRGKSETERFSYAERFAIGKEAGFEAVEMQTIAADAEAAEIKEASTKTGLKIHSVMNSDHWRYPLSSADPEVVANSVKGMETSIKNAALWGADAVLLVPAVVDPATSYRDAWTRSQRVIREQLLPLARDSKIIIAVEEVWNKFLQSPLEFARYVDDFESPWVKAYFDVGNVVINAYPQDWIRTLGSRIVKIHLKDFTVDRKSQTFAFKNLGEGDIDWPEVRRALAETGYSGYVTTEIQGGDLAYLKDVSARVDRFIAGEKPLTVSPSAAGGKEAR